MKGKSEEKQEQSGRIRDRKISKAVKENKKLFYSKVNSERKVMDQMEMKVENKYESVLTEKEEIIDRWSEYFEGLLNVDDGREAILCGLKLYES